MAIFRVLKLTLLLPKKQAVFQLNRVKTKDFFMYAGFLIFLVLLPNGIRLINESINSGSFTREYLLILIFYPSLIILFSIIGISLLAAMGMLIKIMTKRKMAYQLLWRMTIYVLTYPVLIYTLFDLIGIQNAWINLLLFLIFVVVFSKMILVYPKARR